MACARGHYGTSSRIRNFVGFLTVTGSELAIRARGRGP
jgi:hypothetical protein